MQPVAVAHPIGVVPDETAVVEHHEVDGAQVLGIRIELVDDVEDELLAGVRDVHRGEAQALRLGEEGADVCPRACRAR